MRIADAAIAAGRDPAMVRLLAVSKTWPADSVREAAAAGQRAFGENYVQEGAAKVDERAIIHHCAHGALADLPFGNFR